MIKKAVIPCGGKGTRFLPITKSIPKELLPVVDIPVLSYIIKEFVDSGIESVLLVISPTKEIIKDYFRRDNRLYDELMEAGKYDLAQSVKDISDHIDIDYVCQNHALGSANAVDLAKNFTGMEPFVLAFGDDLTIADVPVSKQLINAFDVTGGTVVGVQKCLTDDITKYGVAKVRSSNEKYHLLDGFVEKPSLDDLPSRLACYGRYVLNNIYEYISKIGVGKGGELQLTDALELQCQSEKSYAYDFDGVRYDMGDKLSSLKAAIELSLNRKDFGADLKEYIKNLASTL